MYTKPTRSNHQTMFFNLESQLNHKHPLYLLSNKIDWPVFEEAFSPLYCEDNGRPCKPIRRMVGLLILKHVRNVSDESVVEQWQENVYYQYFCGEQELQTGVPFTPTELVAFRKRIGELGMELILKESVRVNDDHDETDRAFIDSTFQEKNVTFPTDAKLTRKIIGRVSKINDRLKLPMCQNYKFGNKVSIVRTWNGLIVGALSFRNEYDGHTIDASLEQTERLTDRRPKMLAGDRGYRDRIRSVHTEVVIPGVSNKGDSYYIKRKKHELFCKRAGIEPVIGHLKSDHRLCRNYYARVFGDNINVMLSAAAFNFKRAMRHLFALLRPGIFQPLCDMLLILLPVNRIPAVAVERARGAF